MRDVSDVELIDSIVLGHMITLARNEIVRRQPSTRIIYIGTEQFTNEYVAAIQGRTTLWAQGVPLLVAEASEALRLA